jgi:hypothetical protein
MASRSVLLVGETRDTYVFLAHKLYIRSSKTMMGLTVLGLYNDDVWTAYEDAASVMMERLPRILCG